MSSESQFTKPQDSANVVDHHQATSGTKQSSAASTPTVAAPLSSYHSPYRAHETSVKRKRSLDDEHVCDISRTSKRTMLGVMYHQEPHNPALRDPRLDMSSNDPRGSYSHPPPTIPVPHSSDLKIQLPPIRELTGLPAWKGSAPSDHTPRDRRDPTVTSSHGDPGLSPTRSRADIRLPPISTIGLGRQEPSSAQTASTASTSHSDRYGYLTASSSSNTGSSPGDWSAAPSAHSRYTTPRSSNSEMSIPSRSGFPPSHMSARPPLSQHPARSMHDISGLHSAGPLGTPIAERGGSLQTAGNMGPGPSAPPVRADGMAPRAPFISPEGGDRYSWNEMAATDEQSPRRRRGNLPKESTAILNDWFGQHLSHPYPTEDEKQQFQAQTGLTMSQISNWFINARRRRLTNRGGDREDRRDSRSDHPLSHDMG